MITEEQVAQEYRKRRLHQAVSRAVDRAAAAQERAHNGDRRYTDNPDKAADRACQAVEVAARKEGFETIWPGIYPAFIDKQSGVTVYV